MKKLNYFFCLVLLTFVATSCEEPQLNENNLPEPPVENPGSFDLKLYRPEVACISGNQQLQTTLISGDIQLSAFGSFNPDQSPNPGTGLYIFDKIKKEEAIVLFDENNEPAFVYSIDTKTGKRKNTVVEFEKVDDGKFYLRAFYYDWQNRLGTLLFETVVEKEGAGFKSTPTFEINAADFNVDNSNARTAFTQPEKRTRSFAAPLVRLNTILNSTGTASSQQRTSSLSVSEEGPDNYLTAFNHLRNSTIGSFLNNAQNGGLTLAALGASAAILGSATVGPYLAVAGMSVYLVSTANRIVITDHYTNLVQQFNDRRNQLLIFAGEALQVAGNRLAAFSSYRFNFSDHMIEGFAGIRRNFSSLESWQRLLELNLFIRAEDLDDLPDLGGVLQFALSWETNATDIDLWVTDPSGERVFFGHPSSASGGYLDRDDVDGFGPENIYWLNDIPDGTYFVQVHYYWSSFLPAPATPYTVKITNGLGFARTVSGILQNSRDLHNVATVVKSGTNISVQSTL